MPKKEIVRACSLRCLVRVVCLQVSYLLPVFVYLLWLCGVCGLCNLTLSIEREHVRYGITTGLNSWSPIWGNLHYFGMLNHINAHQTPPHSFQAYMYELSTELRGFKKLQVLYKGPDWYPATYKPTISK